jgi:hypothetical protein
MWYLKGQSVKSRLKRVRAEKRLQKKHFISPDFAFWTGQNARQYAENARISSRKRRFWTDFDRKSGFWVDLRFNRLVPLWKYVRAN